MKKLLTISLFCITLTMCKSKDVLDFWTDDHDLIVDDTIVQNQPVNTPKKSADSDSNMIALPFKPWIKPEDENDYVEKKHGTSKPQNFVKIGYKPESYWYSGHRKKKVAEKARQISSSKKRDFINIIGSKVAETNQKIFEIKLRLSALTSNIVNSRKISSSDKNWLNNLADEYKVKNFNPLSKKSLEELNIRVDTVPESVAIAQAAIESAWGKSRFAKLANNYFGQWCFKKGCGVVPLKRDPNKTHEVKKFKTPQEAVEAYIHNINTNRAYKNFRIARRNMGSRVNGIELASHLGKYSSEGSKYIKTVKSVIIKNNLE